ncbi:GNAT family N-acetyltransferase [Candidatus Roizmanbacteria bacterium]|nr:GNAT family N-acetyltransferase [Candidatus Roizmanbacteria bacterium]
MSDFLSPPFSENLKPASIRKLREEDLSNIQDLLRFWLIDYQQSRENITFEEDVVEYINVIKKTLQENGWSKFFVADVENKVVGLFGFTKEVDPILLEYRSNGLSKQQLTQFRFLFVHPEYHRHGIGTTLVDTAEKEAVEIGYKEGLFFAHERFYPTGGAFHEKREKQIGDFQFVSSIIHNDQECKIYKVALTKIQ